MRVHSTSRGTARRIDSAFAGANATTAGSRSASIHLLNSSTTPGEHRSAIQSTRMPPTLQSEMAELVAYIDGLPIVMRLLAKDLPTEMHADLASKGADIHSLLSKTVEKIVDRMHEFSLRRDNSSKQPVTTVEVISIGEPSVRPPALSNETVLSVGPLELDLLDRTAKRGDRQIDLRPREFRLLKYMMQRSDKLLTRASLLKDVWNYRFVPETNLVDVHMGRLRRKVDGTNEVPMIRNVRGVGFVLSAAPFPQGSPAIPMHISTVRPFSDAWQVT